MHICIFGNERSIHIKRWVLGLRGLGHRVDLISFQKDLEHDIGGIGLNAARKLSYPLKILQLRNLVNKLSPDIFHSHYASSYGFLASFVRHPRKVVSVWGDDIVIFPRKNFIARIIISQSLSNANHITATSRFLKDTCLKYSKKDIPITVVPFGIDMAKFSTVKRVESSAVTIGIAKWLIPKYGIDVLIRAYELIVNSGYSARLKIGGRGSSENEYRESVRRLKLDDKVDFIGYIKPDDMHGFLASLDIAAMPSISDGESFGVAALEAAATGLPVVASRVGGVPEVVIDGVTGFLVDRMNPRMLADRIITLIEQPELRRQMGIAGREYVERQYRWEDNLLSMEKVYREMMR